jgi:ribonuclease BN (tRNA processing enzyme)
VQLTVIGCSGSFPSPASPASCYLVEHGDAALVLDLGNGSLGPLMAAVDLDRVEGIVLSHLHPDHCLDLTSLHVARTYHPDGPAERTLSVHGPRNTEQRVAAAYRARPDEPVRGMDHTFQFVDHLPTTRIGPFTVTTARVDHPVEAYAIRVSVDGSSLVFSGDTGPTPALVELARGADLALFEASFLERPDNPPNLHLTGAQAGAHATEAGVGRLVLTHLVSWNDRSQTEAEGRSAYAGQLDLATSGMVVEL